jgi:hypothetical protein
MLNDLGYFPDAFQRALMGELDQLGLHLFGVGRGDMRFFRKLLGGCDLAGWVFPDAHIHWIKK